MISSNKKYLKCPFSKKLWWKPEYTNFDPLEILKMMSNFKTNILNFFSNPENVIWSRDYFEKFFFFSYIFLSFQLIKKIF